MRGDSPEADTCYRLRGEVDGKPGCFALKPGKNIFGSDVSNAGCLRIRGVSRFHAVVDVGPGGVTLQDLESKNGTFVNGVEVHSSSLVPGDELRIGPVRLRLEKIDAEDARLGMVVEPVPRVSEAAPRVSPPADEVSTWDTTLLSRDGEEPRQHFRLIDAFIKRLALCPSPDLSGALALLSQSLEAAAAAVVEWHGDARGVVVGIAGQLAEVPSMAEARAAHPSRYDADLRFLSSEAPVVRTCAILAPRGLPTLGLVLWGEFPGRLLSRPLLGTLLHVTRHFRPRQVRALKAPPEGPECELRFPPGIVPSTSPRMVSLYQQMRLLTRGDMPVLLLGETGVGKEHLARTLHDSSPRRAGPLVAVNCAAIPAELLEAEMFGIGKGVATGVAARRGRFQEAEGGTLFLDEIGDMAPALQAKLLRVLQEKQVRPLGRNAEPVDVRIISATNTDLRRRITEGKFRQDLYFRLAGYVLEVPPLRERSEDLSRFIAHFMHVFCQEIEKSVVGVTVKALRALTGYGWPGNVRELEHEVRRLVYLCPEGGAIDSELVSSHILYPLEEDCSPQTLELGPHIEAVERRLVHLALIQTGGNQTRAAKLLGISRNGLAKLRKRLAVPPGEP